MDINKLIQLLLIDSKKLDLIENPIIINIFLELLFVKMEAFGVGDMKRLKVNFLDPLKKKINDFIIANANSLKDEKNYFGQQSNSAKTAILKLEETNKILEDNNKEISEQRETEKRQCIVKIELLTENLKTAKNLAIRFSDENKKLLKEIETLSINEQEAKSIALDIIKKKEKNSEIAEMLKDKSNIQTIETVFNQLLPNDEIKLVIRYINFLLTGDTKFLLEEDNADNLMVIQKNIEESKIKILKQNIITLNEIEKFQIKTEKIIKNAYINGYFTISETILNEIADNYSLFKKLKDLSFV